MSREKIFKDAYKPKTYSVGGSVRDELLGIEPKDKDYVIVGATPSELKSLGYKQVSKSFPVFLHPETKDEYALARTEKKSGPGHYGFVVGFDPSVTLEEDLRRRDLTVNAMAKDELGNLIDPYNGKRDLENKILRHVSNSFHEDPLRVLRIARFLARYKNLGFTIHPDTMALMKEIVSSGELKYLTVERVLIETQKALSEEAPSAYFYSLRECGALKVVLPEIDALFGVPQAAVHHPEVDTGIHTMMAVDYARKTYNDIEITWLALIHDLGKAVTPKDLLPRHFGHEEAGVPLAADLCKRFKVSKDTLNASVAMSKYHLNAHKAFELRPSTVLKLIKSLDGFRNPEKFTRFLSACESDARGRLGLEGSDYFQKPYLIDCLKAASGVDRTSLIEKGVVGKKFGEQLMNLQIEAIRKVKSDHHLGERSGC